MKERLKIDNFAGIKELDISLNKINVFIGPQATGKSICAKLLFFFKKFDTELINAVENELSKKEFDNHLTKKFNEYFPIHTYPKQGFYIKYEINDSFIEIKCPEGKNVEISYSDEYKKIFNLNKVLYKKNKRGYWRILGF